jgi:hypothetical protein
MTTSEKVEFRLGICAHEFVRDYAQSYQRHRQRRSNQELVIFRKAADGKSKIARHSFSPTGRQRE